MSGLSGDEVNAKLATIHAQYNIEYGSFQDELPEQKMAVRYLTGTEKVLEIGGNVGRNSLIIAYLVGDDNLVTLESDPEIAEQLTRNRNINNRHFHIEPSALSAKRLVQNGWVTQPSEVLPHGYKWVNTITWPDLQKKYNIPFDTLVLDCEGAFYYILQDSPEILNNIKLIIIENDFIGDGHKENVREQFKANGFQRVYHETHPHDPTNAHHLNFFEVWKK
jgi:FkbM family methyltransferase